MFITLESTYNDWLPNIKLVTQYIPIIILKVSKTELG